MQLKVRLLLLMTMVISSVSFAQKSSVILPDIPGFYTLKGDFHMHTVFSDGHVWPTFRVNEAIRDDLDVISLTEHIDYEGFPDLVEKDYNKSYEIATIAAKGKGLIIIKGVEISPRVAPYHHNALFLEDANALPTEYMKSGKAEFVMKDSITHDQLMGPFLAAKKQNAFVVYNHPSWGWWDKKDTLLFTSFHRELLDLDILKGVEVVNSGKYNVIAHRIAMEHNLTMLCNTDEHYDNHPRYKDTHRPMTLVFAKEKTAEGVEEALFAKRTALYFGDYVVARQPEAEALFKSAIQVSTERKLRKAEPLLIVNFVNSSDIPFETKMQAAYDIEGAPLGRVTIPAQDSVQVILKAVWKYPEEVKIKVLVENLLVTPDSGLQTEFIVTTNQD
ncbi:Sb-PDE family phosphodiesterase [Algoriphagus sp. C2-6-M1]|uniref:Sb-PDE family phosphodiesterase n=1 Tax=Algoriphagus persicinus TaxID=3108754 RepID=UPI002B3FF017|nr:Sb-PDE family phosphodiesterase [Algoriphagus sp. C2-6-M1]MEB2780461.1 Sb-PDE family phosphodiesterase [Algoriphagus sp. C2-6-M1]